MIIANYFKIYILESDLGRFGVGCNVSLKKIFRKLAELHNSESDLKLY